MRRIGLLSPYSPHDTVVWYQAFRRSLRELGWIEGKNIGFEYRYAEGKRDRLSHLAADLVRLNVDIIITSVTPDALAAKKATAIIPIVMAGGANPVEAGLVGSLARPGGNITGLSQMGIELAGKRLELLAEIVPGLSVAAVLWNPHNPASALSWEQLQLPARQLGVRLHSLEVANGSGIGSAFRDAVRARASALVVLGDPVFVSNLKQVVELAANSRLPAMFHIAEFADAGGLVSYGIDRSDMFRRAATYVDRIFRGANPGDLPIEQPIKFELVVNMKTAKALGITVPPSVLVRADRVIE